MTTTETITRTEWDMTRDGTPFGSIGRHRVFIERFPGEGGDAWLATLLYTHTGYTQTDLIIADSIDAARIAAVDWATLEVERYENT